MSSNISKNQPTNNNQTLNQKNTEKIYQNQIPGELSSKIPDIINPQKKNFQESKKTQSKQNEINEKFFPPKTNYFVSESNDKIKNNLQSPIIDYFSNTSNNYLQKYNSPEEIIDANKNIGKLQLN